MGSILITQEGAETSEIREDRRDKVLRGFFEMLDKAVGSGDRSYMTSSAYQHHYSYGEYYPSFVNLDWEEFSSMPAFSGVTWNTYHFIVMHGLKLPWPCKLSSEEDFLSKDQPRGKGGFEQPDSPPDFLCNPDRWNKWHRDYLTENPDRIGWNTGSPFLPNMESVNSILDEEIGKYIRHEFRERISTSACPQKEAGCIRDELFRDRTLHEQEEEMKPLKKNAEAIFFHRVVMPSIGHPDLAGYCVEVGDRICRENYYVYESELSSAEQRAANAHRHIWSVLKNGVKQYISFDFHKGMFEFHDCCGRHLGEYMFDGTLNAGPQRDHNLKTFL